MTRLDLLSEVAPTSENVAPQQIQQHNQQEQQQRSTLDKARGNC